MFRKTLTALIAVAGLSFAGAAFAAEPSTAAAPEKPAVTAPAKAGAKVSHKKVKTAKVAKTESKVETKTEGAQQVDMSKQAAPKAQPRTAHKKVVRTNKKAARTSTSTAKPAPAPAVQK